MEVPPILECVWQLYQDLEANVQISNTDNVRAEESQTVQGLTYPNKYLALTTHH